MEIRPLLSPTSYWKLEKRRVLRHENSNISNFKIITFKTRARSNHILNLHHCNLICGLLGLILLHVSHHVPYFILHLLIFRLLPYNWTVPLLPGKQDSMSQRNACAATLYWGWLDCKESKARILNDTFSKGDNSPVLFVRYIWCSRFWVLAIQHT